MLEKIAEWVDTKLNSASVDAEPVRIRTKALDELEGEVKIGLKPRFLWNRIRLTFRSASTAEDQIWKPLIAEFEAAFLKRLRRLQCELPNGFRMTINLSREMEASYRIEKQWLERQRNEEIGTLRYGSEEIKLTGQAVCLGRAAAPGGIQLDDRSVSREHGRAVCKDTDYYYVQCSTTSRTRLLRDGRFREVLPRVGLRLKHGDRLYCGRGSTPILFQRLEAQSEQN